jgi:hypothetical protein
MILLEPTSGQMRDAERSGSQITEEEPNSEEAVSSERERADILVRVSLQQWFCVASEV